VEAPRPGSKKPPIQAPSITPPPVPSERREPAYGDDPLIGTVLLDRVRIVRAIAQGGMGRVYLGEQTRLNRRCAVKVLDPRLVAGDDAHEFIERFLLEASIAAKLTHPRAAVLSRWSTSRGARSPTS
jgi:serine/threonine-protein kinase